MQAFLLGRVLDSLRSRNHHGPHLGIDFVSLGDPGGRAQVFQTRVGAGTDEYAIHRNILHAGTRLERHVFKHALSGVPVGIVVEAIQFRHALGDRHHHARICAPGHKRRELGGIDLNHLVVLGS